MIALMAKILIVEDDASMVRTLQKFFAVDFEVLSATDGEAGLELALREHPDVIILDITLPGMDGLTLCKSLRRRGCDSPVLFLTGRDTELSKLTGFGVGADDYVTKPASLLEVEARVKAIMRRARAASAEVQDEIFEWDDISVNFTTHVARVRGTEVRLSAKEMELLRVLTQHRGRVVTREDLLERVWNYADDVPSRTLDTHVRNLRRKLADPSGVCPFIQTIHCIGYRFVG